MFGVEGRYAHALFSAASQKNAIESVEKELTDFQVLPVPHSYWGGGYSLCFPADVGLLVCYLNQSHTL